MKQSANWSLLRQEVERRLGRKVQNMEDCLSLSADLLKRTRLRLALNTLRRCFGPVNGLQEPTLHTLETLSRYCGYSSYRHFTDRKSN